MPGPGRGAEGDAGGLRGAESPAYHTVSGGPTANASTNLFAAAGSQREAPRQYPAAATAAAAAAAAARCLSCWRTRENSSLSPVGDNWHAVLRALRHCATLSVVCHLPDVRLQSFWRAPSRSWQGNRQDITPTAWGRDEPRRMGGREQSHAGRVLRKRHFVADDKIPRSRSA